MVPFDDPEVPRLAGEALAAWRRGWRALLAVDLAWKLLFVALLAPLAGGALRAGIALSGKPVVADQEIVFFALRPAGLLVLLVVAGLAVALVALGQANLMAVGAGALSGIRVRVAPSLRWTAQRALPVTGLALRLVGRLLLFALPYLAALAAVGFALLRRYDVNFYLQRRPPELWLAAGLAAAIVALLARGLVVRIVDWSLALPLVLFEEVPPRAALATSAARVAGARGRVARLLVLWATGSTLLWLTLPPAVLACGRLLGPLGRDHLAIVLPLMLVLATLAGLIGLLVGWASATAFAFALLLLFRSCGGHGAGRLAAIAGGEELARDGWRQGPRRAVAAAVVLAAAAGSLGLALLAGVRHDDRVVVIAHRGGAALAPENTLAAIDRGLAAGADSVEIDVQETADGELAVTHDSDFMRLAGEPVKVWDASWAEVERLDVGASFAPEFAGERVPRLREVLERARGRGTVTIELKTYGHGQRLEERVVEAVDAEGAASRISAMSLDYPTVERLRALRPAWTIGLLTAKAMGDLTKLPVDFLAVQAKLATRGFVRRAHDRGRKVYVWTVNDPVRMFQALNLGVDGLITDRPGLAREVIARRARLSALERLLVGLAFHFGWAAPDLAAAADGG